MLRSENKGDKCGSQNRISPSFCLRDLRRIGERITPSALNKIELLRSFTKVMRCYAVSRVRHYTPLLFAGKP